jgi:copper chaperone CopZ
MLKSSTYKVVGEPQLHCASCEQRVVRTLAGQPGVRQVRADASSQQIEVMFDNSAIEETAIAERIHSLGYVTENVSG